jgi:hypothetical protein
MQKIHVKMWNVSRSLHDVTTQKQLRPMLNPEESHRNVIHLNMCTGSHALSIIGLSNNAFNTSDYGAERDRMINW